MLAIRPVRDGDGPRLEHFLGGLPGAATGEAWPGRLAGGWNALLSATNAIDFSRDMLLVVVRGYGLDSEEVVALGGYFAHPQAAGCEFALAVAERWRHQGLGRFLMDKLLACAVSHGY